mgnify:CR=1 FL=1
MRRNSQAGFSLVELLIVVVIGLVLVAFAVPNFIRARANFRISGDITSLNGEILLAKMRASARFTQTRVYMDYTTRKFRTEFWNRATNLWVQEGVGAPQELSQGVNYGYGSVTDRKSTRLNSSHRT